VANQVELKYSFMIKDLRAVRDPFESRFFGLQQDLEAKALALWTRGDKKGAKALLTRHADKQADDVLKSWWTLSEQLYVRYNDGYRNDRDGIAQPVFYPAWWLKLVGYEQGPLSYQKPAPK
jgi:hypothetical protein